MLYLFSKEIMLKSGQKITLDYLGWKNHAKHGKNVTPIPNKVAKSLPFTVSFPGITRVNGAIVKTLKKDISDYHQDKEAEQKAKRLGWHILRQYC